MHDYDKMLQERLDDSFNNILKVTSVIAFFASIILFLADLPVIYAVINFICGLIAMVFTIFQNRFETYYKILVLITLTGIVAVASFIGGGFSSAFLTLLILSNVIAVLFLQRKSSIAVSVISVATLCSLGVYSVFFTDYKSHFGEFYTWSLQIIAYVLFIIALQLSVNTMKQYLIENIMDLEVAIKQSNQLAYYDALTSLPNNHKFLTDVETYIERNHKNGYLVFFRLDSLSSINGTLGTEFGDLALMESSEVLKSLVNEDIIAARTGGNEFALWLSNINDGELVELLHDTLDILTHPNLDFSKKLLFHVGYSKYTEGQDNLQDCYRRAMLTITFAKRNNLVEILSHSEKIDEDVKRKEQLKDLLEVGLKKNEFKLFYQAKVDSRTNKVVGVEGLIRWFSPDLGLISPYEFIPIIESMNMCIPFGKYVLEQACKDFHLLQGKFGEEVTVSVNISPNHIMDFSLPETLKLLMAQYHIPRNQLILEITEDIIIEGIENVKPELMRIKACGVKIALDDFGTGYSSLNYLSQMELDELKIDKSFVGQILDEKMEVLLGTIIYLAKQFELDIVAEGVEEIEQKEILTNLGCHIIQGYLYSKPASLDEILGD